MNQFLGQSDVQSGSSIDEAGEDFYALLGLPPFESNASTISARARDLMRDARKYQVGPRALEAQVQLERLATASACLLDPAQKVTYDNLLRERFGLPPVSIRSQYVPAQPDTQTEQPRSGSFLSPRLALALIVLLAIVAILVAQHRQHTTSADPLKRGGSDRSGSFLNEPSQPAAPPGKMPSGVPIATRTPGPEQTGTSPAHSSLESTHAPALTVRPTTESPDVNAPPGSKPPDAAPPAAGSVADVPPPRPNATSRSATAPPGAAPPGVSQPAAMPVRHPQVAPPAGWPLAGHDPAAPADAQLSSAEVLRQLKDFRLNRSPARRLATNPQMLGAHRIVELVKYGRSTFPDDRRFQKQLDQEVIALRRLYPPFRDVLPEPEH